MCKSILNISQPQNPDVDLRADWTTGPRTAAWEELWRRIFAEALHDKDDIDGSVVEGTRYDD